MEHSGLITRERPIDFGKFDIVLTNPPFSIDVNKEISQHYKFNGKKTYKQSHILFIKRGLDLLKPGGKMGIILPESLLSNDTTKDVLQDVQKTAIIKAVVSLPEIAFAMAGGRGTTAKTACLIVQKRTSEQPHENYEIFMAIIKDCGKNIGSFVSKKDETSLVSKNYIERTERSELGFYVNSTDIDNFMYIPEKYYKNTIPIIRQTLFTTNTFHKLKDLEDSKIIEIKTFGGIKSEDYVSDVSERAKRCERTSEANERSDVSERAKRCERTSEANERNDGGTIPFIRTSDIYEWEILTDTAIKIMDATYLKLPEAKRNHIAGDILFVKSSSVGSLAMITAQNTRIALQCEFIEFEC